MARQRLARRWAAWVAVGVLVGIGFGLSLAACNTARRTASAYDRVLEASDAPDASMVHALTPPDAEAASARLPGVVARRHAVGFVGSVPGLDPRLTRAMLAGGGSRFPIERPTLREGRLPAPDRADEVFVNEFFADEAGTEVGDRLHVELAAPPDFTESVPAPVTVVGIGRLPREAVVDETAGAGVMVFSQAFADRHVDLLAYGATNLDLEPGVDPRRDLAPVLGSLGFELQEVRDQEEAAVDEALRPMIVILFGLGALLFVATAVVSAQVFQRTFEASRPDDDQLQRLGMTRHQILLALLIPVALAAIASVAVAVLLVAAMSPLAPAGPLRALDPGRGVVVEPEVAVLGAALILVTTLGTATVLARRRDRDEDPRDTRLQASAWAPQHPTAGAGLALSFGGRDRRRRARRSAGFATAAVILTTLIGTMVAAATTLSRTPERYGFDWDLLAVTPYGDQTEEGLEEAFGDRAEVAAAAGFSSWGVLLNDRGFPALAVTPVKGTLGPTILEGRELRADGDIVLGRDTLDQLGLDVGDHVDVAARASDGSPPGAPTPFRIVGIATFPPVRQIGTDQPRLGTGALITRSALDRLVGSDATDPEWTAVRLVAGASPEAVIARLPEGVPDATGAPTSWYLDAKPAELRQLDGVAPLLFGAVAVSLLTTFGVVVHGLWSQTRANRRELAILGAIGFTGRQRSRAAAWQAVPVSAAVLVIGVPIGIAVGRLAYTRFARSLAVDDRFSIPVFVPVLLVAGTLLALMMGTVVAASVARRARVAPLLRSE